MKLDDKLHLLEIAVLGAPLWWGALRLAFLLKEYPPHRHLGNGQIIYPRGYRPSFIETEGKERP